MWSLGAVAQGVSVHGRRDRADRRRTAKGCGHLAADSPLPDLCPSTQYLRSQSRNTINSTWTPKVCKMIAFWAVFSGFGHYFTYFGGPGMTSEASNIGCLGPPRGISALLWSKYFFEP